MMIHPDIYAALARERTRTVLAEAEAARRSRRRRRPSRRPSEGRPVRLRDGLGVLMRPVRPEDPGLFEDGFADALGALDHARGGGVGIAQYIRDREDPCAAEIARP